ncbi:MAG: hypothetical protein FJ029_15600, partial [Actinobacteria bacterium]|nr:hypothetical protein [Actinomycetota bacterium]
VLAAVGVGLLAAKVRAPGTLVHLGASLMGLAFVGWLMIGVVPGITWEENLVELVSRLLAWTLAAARGGISNDSVPFGFLLSALTWAISYWTIWSVVRGHRAWLALGPATVAILVNLSHFPTGTGGLFALYVALALLLVVRINVQHQQGAWDRSQTEYGRGLSLGLLQEASLATVAVVLLAWQLPLLHAAPAVRSAWKSVTSPWTGAESEFGRLFSSLRSSKLAPLFNFDTVFPLRGQVNLGQNVVMTVTAEMPAYWKGRSYDVYTSKGWLSSDLVTRPVEVSPEEPVVEGYALQRLASFSFEQLQATNVVFSPGHPVEVSVPAQAERTRETSYVLDLQDAGKNQGLPQDLAELAETLRLRQERGPLTKAAVETGLPSDVRLSSPVSGRSQAGQLTVTRVEPHVGNVMAVRATQRPRGQYNVTAQLSVAEAPALRQAGEDYPGWVRDRYLVLPEQLPGRIGSLSREITRPTIRRWPYRITCAGCATRLRSRRRPASAT